MQQILRISIQFAHVSVNKEGENKETKKKHFSAVFLLGLGTVDADACCVYCMCTLPVFQARRKQLCRVLLQESKDKKFVRH